MNNPWISYSLFFLAALPLAGQQKLLKGLVVERDSVSPMPFVYIISKSTGNGTMSDNDGRFSLVTNIHDTLVCSYVGYLRQLFPVAQLRANENGEVRLPMLALPVDLSEITITAFRIKPYERVYMQDIIDKSRFRHYDYVQSPITALYMQFSKEGRQVQKLAKIFEQLFIEEQVLRKLNKDILRKLTGDDKIDFDAFRKYCYYVDDEYIITHEGAELYSRVMDCYRRWKQEMR